MINTVINNKYTIIQKLGEGGTGVVYLAEDLLHDNRRIALKVIKKDIVKSTGIIQIKKEYDIMTRLMHPNLIRVYNLEFDEHNGIHFITMEYIDGSSLQTMLGKHKQLPPDTVISYLVKLCRAIDFIHSRNIIHRDIKPDNIFVVGDDVKIMDLGLADFNEHAGIIKGTLYYMAPEIFSGEYDHRIDIFALGMTCFEMISGVSVFDEKKTWSIINNLKNNTAYFKFIKTKLRDLNSTLTPIIEKMISFDSHDRYQNCTMIIEEINRKFGYDYPLETDETKIAYVLKTDFIGRHKEITRLMDVINHRQNACLSVTGDPGIGKSRLFNELQKYCYLNDVLFYKGDCPKDFRKTLTPFLIILSELLLKSHPELIKKYGKELKKILPDHHCLKKISPTPEQSPEIEKIIIGTAIADFIIEYEESAGIPIVLLFNDMQWADEVTILALDLLLKKLYAKHRSTFSCGLFVFIAGRQKRRDKLLAVLKKYRIEEITLQEFKPDNVYEYFNALFGADNIGETLEKAIDYMYQKIGGNPFYLQQLVKSLVESQVIIHTPGKWELAVPMKEIAIPDDIKEVIGNRYITHLPGEDEIAVIEVIALLDRWVAVDELAEIIPVEVDLLQQLVDRELLKNDIIENKVVYLIYHDLLRLAIINRMSAKSDIHALIAHNLEKLHRHNAEYYYEELAYHFHNSGIKQKAIEYLEKSCNKQSVYFDTPTEIDLNLKLLTLLDDDPRKRIDILNKLCYFYNEVLFDYDKSFAYANQALTLANEVGDMEYIAHSHARLASSYRLSKKPHRMVIDHYEKALEYYLIVKNTKRIAEVYNEIGVHYWLNLKEYDVAVKYHKLGLLYAKKIRYKRMIAMNTGNIGTIYYLKGNFDKAISCLKSANKIIRGLQDKLKIIVNTGETANAYVDKGEPLKAIDYYSEAIAVAREISSSFLTVEYMLGLINAFVQLKYVDKAFALFKKGFKLLEEVDSAEFRTLYNIMFARILVLKDKNDHAVDVLKKTVGQTNDRLLRAECYYELWNITRKDDYKQKALTIYTAVPISKLEHKNKSRLARLNE